MPAFSAYEDLMAALDADVMVAWPDTKKIYHGPPASVQKTLPYAVIWLDPETPMVQAADSAQGFTQRPQFVVTRVAPLPADKTAPVQGTQVSEANTLIERLERSSYYQSVAGANLAQWPIGMLGGIPTPLADDKDKVYEVNVGFTCAIRMLHTSKQ